MAIVGIKQEICNCERLLEARTYYVWLVTGEKEKVEDVAEIYVTRDDIVLEKQSHKTIVVPRKDVFMVTCVLCSPPPCC